MKEKMIAHNPTTLSTSPCFPWNIILIKGLLSKVNQKASV